MIQPHFLELVRGDLCHPEAVRLVSAAQGPALVCDACGTTPLPDLYAYIERWTAEDYFLSGRLALAYAAWTGDRRVRVSFPLTHVAGIYDTVVVGQTLDRVLKSVRLLRALHAPFANGEPGATDLSGRHFLAEFLEIVREHPESETSQARTALDALLCSMHTMLAERDAVDPFRTYFDVLVPYVQRCAAAAAAAQPLEEAGAEEENPTRELHAQFIRSHRVRQRYGRYCVPFDVIHVMVCCYACSCDMDVVGNWAVDFLARLCRGDFFWKTFETCDFVQAMQRLVAKAIHPRRQAKLYYAVVQPLQKGQALDQYSQLWMPLHEAQALLRREYVVPGCTPDVLQMAFDHCFPAVLFDDPADQLGFAMGYNHLIMTVNRRDGRLPKGAFQKAKSVHSVVRRFVDRVRDFDPEKGGSRTIWNLEMVKLFFASDEDFQKEIMSVIELLMNS